MHFPAEGRWRQGGLFLEKAREIGLVFHAHGGGDVDDGVPGFSQEAFGLLDTCYIDPATDAASRGILDQTAQVVFADTGLCGV